MNVGTKQHLLAHQIPVSENVASVAGGHAKDMTDVVIVTVLEGVKTADNCPKCAK